MDRSPPRPALAAALALASLALPLSAAAHEATIEDARFQKGAGGWTVSVTLTHAETGWDEYADGWRVEAPDGTVLGERPLAHPHVNEQPFTRSTSGVVIPDDLTSVFIRARTNTDGWGASRREFSLNR